MEQKYLKYCEKTTGPTFLVIAEYLLPLQKGFCLLKLTL